jgi:hypothetical protein
MQKKNALRKMVFGIVLIGLTAMMLLAAVPAQAAFPQAPAVQETVVVPTVVVNPTVVIPPTGGDTSTGAGTTNWIIPLVIIVGLALVAVAIASSRGSRTDV